MSWAQSPESMGMVAILYKAQMTYIHLYIRTTSDAIGRLVYELSIILRLRAHI